MPAPWGVRTFAAMESTGLPLDAWVLLAVSVGLGLGLELAFVRAQRARRLGSGSSPAAGEGRGSDESATDARRTESSP